MPHIRDSRMVGRLGVASPMISPLSLRYREEKEKVEIMVWFPFLEPLTLCTVINYVKIIKNKNNHLKLKKKKKSRAIIHCFSAALAGSWNGWEAANTGTSALAIPGSTALQHQPWWSLLHCQTLPTNLFVIFSLLKQSFTGAIQNSMEKAANSKFIRETHLWNFCITFFIICIFHNLLWKSLIHAIKRNRTDFFFTPSN